MLQNVPNYISILFAITTVATLLLFYWTLRNSTSENVRNKTKFIVFGMIIWLILQAILSLNNVYNSNTSAIPPNVLLFGVAPTLLLLITIFTTKKGKSFAESLDLKALTFINIVRIPVEIVLYLLFLQKSVPELMTFEGSNFDILAGISAPFVVYFGIQKGKLRRNLLLIWITICLLLLFNIIILAFLSAPSPFQKLAFNQPNIAILNFPFSCLQTFIVPLILFGHIASIQKLIKTKIN